jgi:polyisoprenoid-binding protein YceI
MNGVSKEIKLDVEYGGKMKDPWGTEKAGFTITGKINRKDWKIAWNAPLEAGGVLLSDEVAINCEVQLVKKIGQELKAETESSKNEEITV